MFLSDLQHFLIGEEEFISEVLKKEAKREFEK